jgi:exosortase A-associated hydrolase 1
MKYTEEATVFPCDGETLVGVLCRPEAGASKRGVLIVVGGPQYRAGSHRQFTLLARDLGQAGIASLRFDYRGMGDSSGAARSFERSGDDIRAAIDELCRREPGLQDIVIWALCDAASAALFYAHGDRRVTGLVLLNPWVRTEQGAARVQLRHYYATRLFQPGLWRKIASGEFRFGQAVAGLWRSAASATRARSATPDKPLPQRMEEGLRNFRGRVLVILSGDDLTAQEFKDLVAGSPSWGKLLDDPRVTRRELPEANHTFSRREWRDQVAAWTAEWIKHSSA